MFHMLIAIGLAAIGLVVVLYLAISVVCFWWLPGPLRFWRSHTGTRRWACC
jgi:hypothetical protein